MQRRKIHCSSSLIPRLTVAGQSPAYSVLYASLSKLAKCIRNMRLHILRSLGRGLSFRCYRSDHNESNFAFLSALSRMFFIFLRLVFSLCCKMAFMIDLNFDNLLAIEQQRLLYMYVLVYLTV